MLAQGAVLPIAGDPTDIFCFRMRTEKQRATVAISKQDGTLPHLAVCSDHRGEKRLEIVPMAQIFRFVQQCGSTLSWYSGTDQKNPPFPLPPNKRITKIG